MSASLGKKVAVLIRISKKVRLNEREMTRFYLVRSTKKDYY